MVGQIVHCRLYDVVITALPRGYLTLLRQIQETMKEDPVTTPDRLPPIGILTGSNMLDCLSLSAHEVYGIESGHYTTCRCQQSKSLDTLPINHRLRQRIS